MRRPYPADMVTLLAGIGAVVCMFLAAFKVDSPDINLVYLSLALFFLAWLAYKLEVWPVPWARQQ